MLFLPCFLKLSLKSCVGIYRIEVMKKQFKPRARMLLQLGDQLIRNENIAIAELVKNSYDADATYCNVTLRNIDKQEDGVIEITDDGIGMNLEVIENVWLEPGADFKDIILKGKQVRFEFATTIPKRTPIGEKGIGRFGVHKLGDLITLVTKSSDSNKEIEINIDWRKFGEAKYLEDANIEITERHPKIFDRGRTGTQITIKKIRKKWKKESFQELHRNITALTSPFEEKFKFEVFLKLELKDAVKTQKWQEGLLSMDEIKDRAVWKLDCVLEGKHLSKFTLEFQPPATLDKLEKREWLH